MAKKKQETASLIETFAEFKQNKNIDLTTMWVCSKKASVAL